MSLTAPGVVTTIAPLHTWLESRRASSRLEVAEIPASACAEWEVGGEIQHRSGRFFQVVGMTADGGGFDGWSQPLIRQTELGILGFLVDRRAGAAQWLVQAKTEPGNVGGTQLAPTVQATVSNYTQVHGGAPTRYLEWFTGAGPHATVLSDVPGSEQGTRFLHKHNRNVVVAVDGEPPDIAPGWTWASPPEVRRLLVTDFMLNTDARSVIVTAPWDLLADTGRAFCADVRRDDFSRALVQSHTAVPAVENVLQRLDDRRCRPLLGSSQAPLQQLPGWVVHDEGIGSETSDSRLLYVRVSVADREVDQWCQPLLATAEARCQLWCRRRRGRLEFLFRYAEEPGLRTHVELAPSWQSDVPGAATGCLGEHAIRLTVRQSDEGGRFYRSVCHYVVVELLDDDFRPPPDHVWLTLADVQELLRTPLTFTNEARSVISLLLSQA